MAAMTMDTLSDDILCPVPDIAPMSQADLDAAIEGVRQAVGLPQGARVVAAMSGGVDSTVVAALLHKAGYDVVGVTLQLYDHGEALKKKGACCAGQDIHDARLAADLIGIPHYVLDYENRFKDAVIDQFADSYLKGQTPVPCIRCNQTVKFRDLLDVARDLGAEAMATGHYVRRATHGNRSQMRKAVDHSRDQSYFLFATTQDQLDYLRFPLADLEKPQVRGVAASLGLRIAAKPDSQDICFVPSGKYVSVIERLRPGASDPGKIVHLDGRVVGAHKGIIHYTIGQRRGLGIGGGEVLYVVRLDPERKQVIVGPQEALLVKEISLKELNWLGDEPLSADGVPVGVKVRSTRPPLPGVVYPTADGARVVLADAEAGVSPGQACVFYAGSRVLGGGWIREARSLVDWTAAAADEKIATKTGAPTKTLSNCA